MSGQLRHYVAFNNGLKVMQAKGDSVNEIGEFFSGKTLEHLIGCRQRPEVVFAAVAFDGGYRTEDGGRSWQKVLDGDVRTFTVDPHDERVVYAGTGPIRLFRSEDNGVSWEPLDSLLELPAEVQKQWTVPEAYRGVIPPHVRYIFVHPDDTRVIFVVLEHGGIVLSRDGGATWKDASSGIPYLDMHLLRNFPGSKERYYVSSARGFFRSDDEGHEWHRVENGMPWAYTELYSYSHAWFLVEPRDLLESGGGRIETRWGTYCGATTMAIAGTPPPTCPMICPGSHGCCCSILPMKKPSLQAWETAPAVSGSILHNGVRAPFMYRAIAGIRGNRFCPESPLC
jgi:hypothetical protein